MDIVFDVGGVILHWDPKTIARQVFPDRGMQDRFLSRVFHEAYWLGYDKGELTGAQLASAVERNLGIPQELMAAFIERTKANLLPKEATLDLVRQLREEGHRLFILSNMPSEVADYICSAYEFWDLFDGKVFSGYVHLVKPDEEIFHYLLCEYQLIPEQTMFIDDSEQNIEAASRLGMHGVLFQDADSCREKLNAYIAKGETYEQQRLY